MSSLTDRLTIKGLIQPPKFIKSNVHYEVMMGSEAYGCNTDTSDIDVYAFCVPPKGMLFPHTEGHIKGFGSSTKPQEFNQFQKHHIKDENKEYDLTVYSIIRYFQLCMENNPNMIDSLFVPRRCILFSTQLAEHMRENRKLFLHKGSYHKFKGYSFSQLNLMNGKRIGEWVRWSKEHNHNYTNPPSELAPYSIHLLWKEVTKSGNLSKRAEGIDKYGYDLKFAYHLVRLLDEALQILLEGDLTLDRNREQLKSIRRGEWSKGRIIKYFEDKERQLEQAYADSKLRHQPDELAIRKVLLECLEMHYGKISEFTSEVNNSESALLEIKEVLRKRGI